MAPCETARCTPPTLGSWTVTGNLSKGPIGAHGLSVTGGDAALTISSNRFEAINGDALRASDALGSWTVTGNLSKGPIGGDGISIAGGSAEAQVTISDNEFERIDGNGISAQDALGSWTVTGNLSRGPIGGHAMHFSQPKRRRRHDQQHGQRLGAGAGQRLGCLDDHREHGRRRASRSRSRAGFEFVGLSAQSTLNCTDNTLSYVGGGALHLKTLRRSQRSRTTKSATHGAARVARTELT